MRTYKLHYNKRICGKSHTDINPETVGAAREETRIRRDARRVEVYFALAQQFASPISNLFLISPIICILRLPI